MGSERGSVAGREHEAAKGGYGLTSDDILEPTYKTALSLREATLISVEPSPS